MEYSNGNIVNMYLYTLEMALCKIYMAWRMWLYSQRMLKMGFILDNSKFIIVRFILMDDLSK